MDKDRAENALNHIIKLYFDPLCKMRLSYWDITLVLRHSHRFPFERRKQSHISGALITK